MRIVVSWKWLSLQLLSTFFSIKFSSPSNFLPFIRSIWIGCCFLFHVPSLGILDQHVHKRLHLCFPHGSWGNWIPSNTFLQHFFPTLVTISNNNQSSLFGNNRSFGESRIQREWGRKLKVRNRLSHCKPFGILRSVSFFYVFLSMFLVSSLPECLSLSLFLTFSLTLTHDDLVTWSIMNSLMTTLFLPSSFLPVSSNLIVSCNHFA